MRLKKMNKIVIDANIVFSALIAYRWNTKMLLYSFFTKKLIRIYAPSFLKKEVFKYITKIIEEKKLPYEEFLRIC